LTRSYEFSFEIFPPKKTSSIETVYDAIKNLAQMNPDFISVTYGAGGSRQSNKTCELASLVKNKHHIKAIAHLTCINSTKDQVSEILTDLKAHGIENILALRGDRNPDMEETKDFKYAYELVQYIKENGNFHLYGACYPEAHPECESYEKDLLHLKHKVELGVEHLITQLFFDNEIFYRFLNDIRKLGIHQPVHAGIMPVTNLKQILRMTGMCGASIPGKLSKVLSQYFNDDEGLYKAGLDYAVEQINDLIAHGIDGIHLYTMNNPKVASYIIENIDK
jgi:methylenetetrahydrofolate reductase (NAD(P)H)